MLVAIYARTSIDGNVSPVEEQILKCEEFCEQNGFTVVGKFVDDTITNTPVFQRPGIVKLIQNLIVNNIFLVVTEHVSCISENVDYLDAFYIRMAFLNVTIETLKSHSFTPMSSAPEMSLQEIRKRRLGDTTRDRIIANAMNGNIPGGPIFGYEPDTGVRHINDEQADIVKDIFSRFAGGEKPLQICRSLNEQGIPSPSNGQWTPSGSLLGSRSRKTGLLRQTLYDGTLTINKMAYHKHPETGKRFSVVRPEDEWIRIPLPELRIVDQSTYKKVQKTLDKKEASKSQAKRDRKNLSDDEQRILNLAITTKRRALKGRPGKRPKLIYYRKLFCGLCGFPIISDAQIFNSCLKTDCKNKGMIKEDLIAAIYDKMAGLSSREFAVEVKELHLLAQRKSHVKEELAQYISTLETEYREAVADDKKAKALPAIQDKLNTYRLRLTDLTTELESMNLAQYSEGNISQIIGGFVKQVLHCKAHPEDSIKIDQLKRCINKIEVVQINPEKFTLNISYNISTILLLFGK